MSGFACSRLMIQRAAEHATNMTWAQICDALEGLKAVHCRIENQAIVQTTNPSKAALATLKKLEISKPKTDTQRRLRSQNRHRSPPRYTPKGTCPHNMLKSIGKFYSA